MCSPASTIFTSIVTILVSFGAILMYFKACGRSLLWNWLLKLILTFFKNWINTGEYYHNTLEYCHNTCEYWAGEYTTRDFFWKIWGYFWNFGQELWGISSLTEQKIYPPSNIFQKIFPPSKLSKSIHPPESRVLAHVWYVKHEIDGWQ